MPEFIVQIMARAAITAANETAAGEVADELAKELAALAADMPIYEMEVESVIASGEPEESEPELARTPPNPKPAEFEPSFWKISAWAIGAWWFFTGYYAASAGLGETGLGEDYDVNPLFHTVTIKTSYELPRSKGGKVVGLPVTMRLMEDICESRAAKIPGFGWGVTLEGKDGGVLMSCWSWQ